MLLTPSVKLSAVSSNLTAPELPLRIKPNLWENATVPLLKSSKEPTFGTQKNVPPVRLRSLDSIRQEPLTTKEKMENEIQRNKQKEREKAMMAPTSSRIKTFPQSAVFDSRECAKCHRVLRTMRKDRWSSNESDAAPEAYSQKVSRGMHPPLKGPGSSHSAGATVLRERMSQEILQRYTTASLDWDKGSHVSAASLKEMILTQGHATDVPDPLRHLEPQYKVKAWLSCE